MTLKLRSAAVAAALLASMAAQASGLTLASSFGQGSDFSATDINSLGQVIGLDGSANSLQVWQGGNFTTLLSSSDTLEIVGQNNNGVTLYNTVTGSGALTYGLASLSGNSAVTPSLLGLTLNGINDSGTVAGYFGGLANMCGVALNNGATTANSCVPGSDKAYLALNNVGDLVAVTVTGGVAKTTVESASGGTTALGAFSSVAGINDAGQVAGVVGGRAVLVSNGVTKDLLSSVSGATAAKVYDINKFGQVTGQYNDASGNTVAFLYGADGLTTLDPLGATGTLQWVEGTRVALSDKGQLVMTVFDQNAQQLATAVFNSPDTSVPEPSTYALMGLGLVGISLVARRRRA
jgi:hypothetical protein